MTTQIDELISIARWKILRFYHRRLWLLAAACIWIVSDNLRRDYLRYKARSDGNGAASVVFSEWLGWKLYGTEIYTDNGSMRYF